MPWGTAADLRVETAQGNMVRDEKVRAWGRERGSGPVTDLLFVVNANRPFAEDLPSQYRTLDGVQGAARLRVTGLVANTHLMQETTRETVLAGIHAAREMEAAIGIPLRFCAMVKEVARMVSGAEPIVDNVPILVMERHIVAPFAPTPWGARRRSTVV